MDYKLHKLLACKREIKNIYSFRLIIMANNEIVQAKLRRTLLKYVQVEFIFCG